ncbi:tetratricopeptide repeat protein [Puniceicoccus vermicola]|uniref:Tetratricopeptide repeat protein n=1 Tax=Puniceicoccus vermicola TaxID=388746 RepID=A0A7X1AWT0_9BACT|nr:tetratricopeptide repeat protein [Puniceicoccus vermicola]MBC2600493.1 tetratricopeptide repeat protein [Puniceicoccus vermicola]
MKSSSPFPTSVLYARKVRRGAWGLLVMVHLLVAGVQGLSGQSLSDISDASLIGQLQRKLPNGLIGVRSELVELVQRTEGQPDQEPYLFLLGLSYQDEFAEGGNSTLLENAAEQYKAYIEKFPGGQRYDFVRFNLGGVYADLERPDEAIEQYDWLYRNSGSWTFRNQARDRMASLYISSDRAGEGVSLFQEIFAESSMDPELRSQAAAWLLQGYLALGQPEKILPYLRYLTGRFEAVYDPAFNITLLKSGDELFEKGEYDQAILLYSFVKSRAEIVDFYERRVSSLRADIRFLDPESESYLVIDSELKAAEARLAAVEAIREYDVDMRWRMARVYKETDRTWESLWAFIHLYEDYPEHEQVEDFLYTAYGEAVALGDDPMTEQLAKDYLANEGYDRFRAQVVLGLAQFYSRSDRLESLLALVEEYMEDSPNQRTVAQLMNVVGSFYVRLGEYASLRDYMDTMRSDLDGKEPSTQAVRYWLGLSDLLLADYPRASNTFRTFLEDYGENSIFYEDASYRYAITLFGEQKRGESEEQFAKFVRLFPNSSLRGEAELYLGDLKRDRGAFAEAAEHYRLVADHTENISFLSKATFSLSEVLEASGEPEQAVEVLQAYVDTYGEEGEISDAYFRMGMILGRMDRLGERFEIHGNAIRSLIGDRNRYAVDRLINVYVEDYQRYERSFNDSVALLDRMVEEDEFRRKFLTDRVYQYQYMQSAEGVYVDQSLANLLVRDRAFRSKIIETERPLDPKTMAPRSPIDSDVTREEALVELQVLRDEYAERVSSLEPYSPAALFEPILMEAEANGRLVPQMRAQMALDKLSDEPAELHFDLETLEVAPPAVLLWEAQKYEDSDPQTAITLYRNILRFHPWSDSVYEALLALGDLSVQIAEESGDPEDWAQALTYYNTVTERYAMKVRDAEPYLQKGMVLSQLGRDQDAIDTLGQVLRNPAWKGKDHAKAHLELGMAYRRENQLEEAHGFFERLIVAYGGYAEIVSWAYYYDLLTLEELGEEESVQQLLEEYRTRLSVMADTEAYQQIEEKYEL